MEINSNVLTHVDFDPKSLKVPQLRNILNEYEVHYPSNAKKTELITLFNDNVYSNRSQLLKSFNDAIENANSDGFIDMAKENHHPVDPVVSDADVSVDKAKLTGKTSKKSKAAREEPTESDIEMMVSDGESEKTEKPKKKKSASKSKKKTTSANKVSRPTHSTSDLKEKLTTTTPEVSFKEEGKVDSPFSNENTFQKSPSSSRRSVTPQPRSPQSSKSPSQIDSSKHETPKGSRKRKKSESSEERVKKKPKEDKLEASKKQTPSKVTPKKQTPNKETLTKDTAKEDTFKTGHTPKDVKEVSIIDLSSPKADSKKSTPKRSLKLTPSNVSSRSNISTPRLNSIAGELDESPEAKPVFESLEDEAKHFDAQIKKSRGESAEAPTESEITDELAASLGIKIGGSWPNNMKTQNETLTPGPKLTPNPRRIDFELTKEKSIGEEEDGKQEDKQEEITAGDESDDDADTPVTNEESVEDASDKSSQSKVAFKSILPVFSYIMVWLVLSITGLGVYWYREQTFLIGYCGQEIDEPTFYNPENPVINKLSDVLDSFKPSCVKCPAHARCFDNLELGCFEDFIEFKPWYFDLLPFINPASKKCVPDTKKAEKLEAMIDISLDLLRTKNGLIHCGTGDDNQESGIGLQQLYEILLSMKAPYITVDEFNELWERSIVELEKEPEIIVRQV